MGSTREQLAERGMLVPSARVYDWLTSVLLHGLYRGIATDVAASIKGAGVGASARVLEVGSGTGALASHLMRAGITVTATDLDPLMVARARRRLGTAAVVQEADVADLPFEDASFDVVLATLTVHHWPDLPTASAELARVLRPGGRVLVWELASDPTHIHPQERLQNLGLKHPDLQRVSDRSWPWPLRLRFLRRMEYLRR